MGKLFRSHIGEKYGKLTIIRDININERVDKRLVDCKCDCGKIIYNFPLEKLIYVDKDRKSILACKECIKRDRIAKKAIKFQHLVGKRFGKLVIIEVLKEENKFGSLYVNCRCDCGNLFKVDSRRFYSKNPPLHCGCNRKINGKETYISTIKVGYKSGDLEIIADTGKFIKIKHASSYKDKKHVYEVEDKIWLCRCKCGNTVEVRTTRFVASDRPTHCGCKDKRNLDLTGNRFGKLTVLKEVTKDRFGNRQWLCKCDCGNEVIKTTAHLNLGIGLHCGCEINSIVGKRFDKVIVKEKVGRKQYLCKCDCGNFIILSYDQLRYRKEVNCGCTKKEDKFPIGMRLGKLIILEKINCEHYLCKCDCGNEVTVTKNSLIKGRKDCGCVKKNELVGKRFGKLVVIKLDEPFISSSGKSRNRQWLCKCDCGNIKVVREDYLLTGHTKSCGCTQSHGEEHIGQILAFNNINYIKEKTFKNCVSDKGYPLRFDYYVEELNYVIEYDGIQHFALIRTGWDNLDRFNKRVYHDYLKTKYCVENNIQLIRIPYTLRDSVKLEDLDIKYSTYIIKSLEEYKEYLNEYKDNKKYYKFYQS